MAFEVQSSTSPTTTANAYISVAEFKAYHDDRGNDYSTYSDTDVEKAIVRATDFIDSRWTFAGSRYDSDQSTECPRSGVYDPQTSYELDGYPVELVEACAEYAMVSAGGTSLYPSSNVDDTGRGVKKIMTKADVLEKEVEYFQGSSRNVWKAWPLADGKMIRTRLIASRRRTLGRA
jgi:hypothetical protein